MTDDSCADQLLPDGLAVLGEQIPVDQKEDGQAEEEKEDALAYGHLFALCNLLEYACYHHYRERYCHCNKTVK